ncbi:MAG: UbiA family prenyltransferase, partial [Actinomycetales bacterium]|nr:UbiA family prenyltransferase [Actinomycetales bacterium]
MTPETRAWLEITRVSNLPTVLGGVLVSVAATGALQWRFDRWPLMGWWSPQIAMLAAIAFFYMAGFILNDVFDRRIDHEERPGRPIPSGRIMVGTAIKVAVIMILA